MNIKEFEKVDIKKPADQKLKVEFVYTFYIKKENKTRIVICGSYENKSGIWVSYNYREELRANKNKPDFKYPLIELKINDKPLSKIFKIVLIKGCFYAILCQISLENGKTENRIIFADSSNFHINEKS